MYPEFLSILGRQSIIQHFIIDIHSFKRVSGLDGNFCNGDWKCNHLLTNLVQDWWVCPKFCLNKWFAIHITHKPSHVRLWHIYQHLIALVWSILTILLLVALPWQLALLKSYPVNLSVRTIKNPLPWRWTDVIGDKGKISCVPLSPILRGDWELWWTNGVKSAQQ